MILQRLPAMTITLGVRQGVVRSSEHMLEAQMKALKGGCMVMATVYRASERLSLIHKHRDSAHVVPNHELHKYARSQESSS